MAGRFKPRFNLSLHSHLLVAMGPASHHLGSVGPHQRRDLVDGACPKVPQPALVSSYCDDLVGFRFLPSFDPIFRICLGDVLNKLLSQYQQLTAASLDEATALPFEVYYDEEVFKLEADRIFSKEWVFACAEQAIANPGDYFAFNLGGEAIAILRGQDGEFRAMSNNCRHRGTLLLDDGFGHVGKKNCLPLPRLDL